jgi:predicted SAM-dependent methyltransferase
MAGITHHLLSAVITTLRAVGLELRPRHDEENPALESVPGGLTRIHYGCGTQLFPDWLNVDLYPAGGPALTLRLNLTRRHPFPDGWFEFGYAEDFLEHLEQADQIIFLAECYRTLRPGGVLRLCFPGLDQVLALHYQPATYERALAARSECYEHHAHRSFPSRADMELLGRHIGFSRVEFPSTSQSSHAALAGREHRTGQSAAHLIVELTK